MLNWNRITDLLNPAILAGRPARLRITIPALLFSRLAYPGMESLFNVLGTVIDLSNLYYSSHLRLSLFFGTGRTIEVHDIEPNGLIISESMYSVISELPLNYPVQNTTAYDVIRGMKVYESKDDVLKVCLLWF